MLGLHEHKLKQLISIKIPESESREFGSIFAKHCTLKDFQLPLPNINQYPAIDSTVKDEMICISGIYLPVISHGISNINVPLVKVPSTVKNLHKIALGIMSNKAICILGAVGTGKTTLVEYLAENTGRCLGDNFIKVQLGDQTDSKMLLGTYKCTDIPGEFVWQPGVLTQVMKYV